MLKYLIKKIYKLFINFRGYSKINLVILISILLCIFIMSKYTIVQILSKIFLIYLKIKLYAGVILLIGFISIFIKIHLDLYKANLIQYIYGDIIYVFKQLNIIYNINFFLISIILFISIYLKK